MSWSSFHFAVGMACSGTMAGIGCVMFRKGWRWIPAVMTAGGVWANVPDMPRIWRQDFPNLPFAATLGSGDLERYLHRIGDIFFFHHSLDMQGHGLAILGLILTIFLYNLSILMLMVMESRARNSVANRWWRAHNAHAGKAGTPGSIATPPRQPRRQEIHHHLHRSSHLSRTT